MVRDPGDACVYLITCVKSFILQEEDKTVISIWYNSFRHPSPLHTISATEIQLNFMDVKDQVPTENCVSINPELFLGRPECPSIPCRAILTNKSILSKSDQDLTWLYQSREPAVWDAGTDAGRNTWLPSIFTHAQRLSTRITSEMLWQELHQRCETKIVRSQMTAKRTSRCTYSPTVTIKW